MKTSCGGNRWWVLIFSLTGSMLSVLGVVIIQRTAALSLNWDPEGFCFRAGCGGRGTLRQGSRQRQVLKRNAHQKHTSWPSAFPERRRGPIRWMHPFPLPPIPPLRRVVCIYKEMGELEMGVSLSLCVFV